MKIMQAALKTFGLLLASIPWLTMAQAQEQTLQSAKHHQEHFVQRPPLGNRPIGRRDNDFKIFLNRLKQKDPKTYERLEQLRANDREAFFAELRKLMPARPVFQNRVMKLDKNCRALSQQYHQARTEAEKAAIKIELEAAVQEATDAMINDMKERLKQMTDRLAELEKNRDMAIAKRLDFLLQPPTKSLPETETQQKRPEIVSPSSSRTP